MKAKAVMSVNFSESFGVAKKYIARNPHLTFTAILVMTLTLFLTSVFLTVGVGAQTILTYLETRAQITVFFKNETPEEKILALKDSLEMDIIVAEVHYVSQEEALSIYLGQHRDEPVLLESISANVFPASLEVRASNAKELDGLAKMLGEKEGVEEVVFYRDVVDTFNQWARTFRYGAVFLFAIFSLISFLITLITIGMTIYSRREEIEIMKLVGAEDWFIRIPFLLQGGFYGLTSSLLAIALSLPLIPIINTRMQILLSGSILPSGPFSVSSPFYFIGLFAFEILLGISLGIFGSLAAIKKYLNY